MFLFTQCRRYFSIKCKDKFILAITATFFTTMIILEHDFLTMYVTKNTSHPGHLSQEGDRFIAPKSRMSNLPEDSDKDKILNSLKDSKLDLQLRKIPDPAKEWREEGAKGRSPESPTKLNPDLAMKEIPDSHRNKLPDLTKNEILDSKKDKILDEIITDIQGHLSVMRKELSFVDDNLATDSDNLLQKKSQQIVQFLAQKSQTVQKYSDVFIKIGQILEENSADKSPISRHDLPRRESGYQLNKTSHHEEPEVVYLYSNLNKRVYNGNVTIANQAKVFGYWKKAGIDFELEPDIVEHLSELVEELSKKHAPRYTKFGKLNIFPDDGQLSSYEQFLNSISRYELYPADAPYIKRLLHKLQTSAIADVTQKENDKAQMNLDILCDDGLTATFKPVRFQREQETLADQYYFSDFERHNSEIAGFHLDRLLGFRRVPPSAGRVVNIIKDLKEHIQDEKLRKDFQLSPAGFWCFRADGRCMYCNNRHPLCAHMDNPYSLEGSMKAVLTSKIRRQQWDYPWARSYDVSKAAKWEYDHGYCDHLRSLPLYKSGRRLLDVVDLALVDFLTGNMDRRYYETIADYGQDTFILNLNNAKGFGNPREDEMTCLAPLTQCCLIRFTTLRTLLRYQRGPIHLSDAMRRSMELDVAAPVLLEKHLKALDRRVKIILRTVYDCVRKKSPRLVISDDGF